MLLAYFLLWVILKDSKKYFDKIFDHIDVWQIALKRIEFVLRLVSLANRINP
ncbi:hypothetical protein LCGC14_1237340 [marine sediment metagenome]|uniref:Uncharacterized protein n=1 Tax=marine sediment metagenome TaxID=412755 RepID=A0A0F9L6W1_9ZZZZ